MEESLRITDEIRKRRARILMLVIYLYNSDIRYLLSYKRGEREKGKSLELPAVWNFIIEEGKQVKSQGDKGWIKIEEVGKITKGTEI